MINIPKKKMLFNEKGFSMIEMMIALTILLTGLLAVAQMQITAIQGNNSANRLSMASTLGMDRLERLIRLSFEHADLTGGDHEAADNPINGYEVVWTVTDTSSGGGTTEDTTSASEGSGGVSFKSIKLTVKWTERGIPKQIVFDYLKPSL